jgi:HK97 family phage prohead protease
MDYHAISPSMLERKRLDFSLQLKSLEPDGRFAGYASVFDVVDDQRDTIRPGAFRHTLGGRGADIKLLWQHQADEPIGVFDHIFEDGRGLYVEGRLLLEVQRAREAHALLKAGAISGLSIGYSPVRYTIDAQSGVRVLSAVQLWEVSLVTFPANHASRVTVVKQAEGEAGRESLSLMRSGEGFVLLEALDAAIHTLTLS